MSIDPFTGRNPSYCFVDMEYAEDARRAMEILPGQLVRGRPVKVNFKTEKRSRENRLPTKVYDLGERSVKVRTPNVREGAFAFDRWARRDAESHWTAPQDEKRRVFVGGLPRIPNQDVVNAEMRELFKDFEVEAVSKLVSPRDNMPDEPGSHYYCFVDLSTSKDALDAVEALNGTTTRYGGIHKISLARQRSTGLVRREQRGQNAIERDSQPPRDLSGNWRRRD